MKLSLLLIFLLYIKNLRAQDDDDSVLCTADFCANYIDTNPCPKISDNCKIQNATHNALVLPSPDPCNCCTHCIDNLHEGDDCTLGEVGVVPDGICGPGLTCGTEEKCVKMAAATKPTTQCAKDQANYDTRRKNGQLGHLEVRPQCDTSGFYEPYRCIPGLTCFCVDKNGKRIFGETGDTTVAKFSTCQCSRKYHQAVVFVGRELHPNEHFRCTNTGDYDAIQCIGEKCLCVDASDGAPTYPKNPLVNITEISSKTLACFNESINEEGKYYHECAAKYLEVLKVLRDFKEDGFDTVFEIQFPSCSLDGKYSPVQLDSESASCVTPDGKLIGDYRVPISEMGKMDCNCARSSLLLPEDELEKPVCCPNGNFQRVQCRRGTCYCVDENGYQKGNEEKPQDEKESLSCFSKACVF